MPLAFQDLSERYRALAARIAPWAPVWSASVIESGAAWDRMLARIPPDWLAFGATASDELLFHLSQGAPGTRAPLALDDWLGELRRLCTFERVPRDRLTLAAPPRHLTPKKAHEIERLVGFLKHEFSTVSPDGVLDIGGGVGHLARYLVQELHWKILTLERDPELVRKGEKLTSPSSPPSHTFVCGNFPEALQENRHLVPPGYTLSLGLHTCAALAWRHLESGDTESALLNFGCCYEKLALLPAQDREVERSRIAHDASLPWTEQALFLATRAGTERTFESFRFQQRVLRYRFALDLWLKTHGFHLEAHSVGNTPPLEYRDSFESYAQNRLSHLGLSPPEGAAPFNSFFEAHLKKIDEQRFAAFLQNRLARPLEVLLLLDRALWLAERHPEKANTVRIVECFDPQLSPRNLGIVWNFPSPSVKRHP